jgi:hypothetical protein
MDTFGLPSHKREDVYGTWFTLPTQPQSCRNVAVGVDGRDRYHPLFLSHRQKV